MTLARRTALAVLATTLACLGAAETTCACTPPLSSGVVYGSVSHAGLPVASEVEVEVFPDGCGTEQPADNRGQEPVLSDAEGYDRARVGTQQGADAACVRVMAQSAAGEAAATGGPLRLRPSSPSESVRVDVVVP